MALATIKLVFRKDKINDKNIAPVNLRVIKDRKVSYITTGISVRLDEWDFEKGIVNKKHQNSRRFNFSASGISLFASAYCASSIMFLEVLLAGVDVLIFTTFAMFVIVLTSVYKQLL